MSCSRSVSVHLLRGTGAAALIALAILYGGQSAWLVPTLLIGAVILMRGCPMCWFATLFETLSTRRETAEH